MAPALCMYPERLKCTVGIICGIPFFNGGSVALYLLIRRAGPEKPPAPIIPLQAAGAFEAGLQSLSGLGMAQFYEPADRVTILPGHRGPGSFLHIRISICRPGQFMSRAVCHCGYA